MNKKLLFISFLLVLIPSASAFCLLGFGNCSRDFFLIDQNVSNVDQNITQNGGGAGRTYTSGTPAFIEVNNDANTISQDFDGNFSQSYDGNFDASTQGSADFNSIYLNTPIPDTNAQTACSSLEYLAGDGTCQTIVHTVDTNAATECVAGEFLTGGTGGCLDIGGSVFLPQQLLVPTGTINSGDVNSIQIIDDGQGLSVQEVGGVPGMIIDVNYINVDMFNRITLHTFYMGSAGHTFSVQLFNFSSGVFDTQTSFGQQADFEIVQQNIVSSTNYVSGDGNVTLRLLHSPAGNINHDINVDYAVLEFTSGVASSIDHGALTGLEDAGDHLYALLVDGSRSAEDLNSLTDINSLRFCLNGTASCISDWADVNGGISQADANTSFVQKFPTANQTIAGAFDLTLGGGLKTLDSIEIEEITPILLFDSTSGTWGTNLVQSTDASGGSNFRIDPFPETSTDVARISFFRGSNGSAGSSVRMFDANSSNTVTGEWFARTGNFQSVGDGIFGSGTNDFTINTTGFVFEGDDNSLFVGGDLTADGNFVARGNLNSFGNLDTSRAQVRLFSDGAGSNFGGFLQLHTAVDYDASIVDYRIQAFQDDLFIGASTDPDALEYDGGTGIWNFNNANGVATIGNLGVGVTPDANAALFVVGADQWGAHNYGAQIIASGGRNNAIGIESASGDKPWAIANTAGGNTLTFSAMGELGDIATAPIIVATLNRLDQSTSFEADVNIVGDLRGSGTIFSMHQNTADESDTKLTSITGGGSESNPRSRGSYIYSYGNEHSTEPGSLILAGGNVIGGIDGNVTILTGASLEAARWDRQQNMILAGTIIGGKNIFSAVASADSVAFTTATPDINFNVEDRDDSFYSHSTVANNHEVTILRTGDYFVSYDCQTDVTVGVARDGSKCYLTNNGADMSNMFCSNYNRTTGAGDDSCSRRRLITLALNDVITLRVERTRGSNTLIARGGFQGITLEWAG